MTKAYAISLSAQIKSAPDRITYVVKSGCVLSAGDDEATGKAHRLALESMPHDAGYFNHNANVSPLPKRTVQAIIDHVDEYGED